ncbi:ribokinase [Roseiconus nitratireducens]|uniref:Ribokinase n=1 Tax=Roseiconus nitratireducens TaxID=2605748 RepID=A0A5M6CZQ4_9BACT|nr:ribokinase [Roseiconus nitratireducens]KAA5540704.1 ribokinase [Roseiconus nitratireducens]
MQRSATITVLGSINLDLLVRCQALPAPGQTVAGESLTEVSGGKGANQAVAAARCGAAVRMIGCVGDDGFGDQLRQNLSSEGIDCGAVTTVPHCESGVAIVQLEASGENAIIVVPGANGRLTPDHAEQAAELIRGSDALMLQLESPLPTVAAAARLARQAGVKVILDPAPVPRQLPVELHQVDLLCPNETEASALTGLKLSSIEDAERIARKLHEQGAANVCITLGPRGTLLFDGQQAQLLPSIRVDALDTTAAGDAFAGALAVRWAESGCLEDSVRFANVAGALAASRLGAQPSLARREEIDAALVGD